MVGKISFVGVKTEFEPTPAGAYESKFIDFKFGKTKPEARNPNVDKVDLQFACTEENEWKNRRWFRTCTFTADSLWAFKRTMTALGADVDWEDAEGVDPEAICRSVHNNPCIVKVGLQEYVDENDIDPDTGKGKVKMRNQVDDIVPTEGMRARMIEEARAAVQAPPA